MMNKINMLRIVFLILCGFLYEALYSSEIDITTSPSITDRFVLKGAELFKNPSFEKMNDRKDFPEGFVVTKKDKDYFLIVNDYLKANHGNIFLSIDNRKKGTTSTLYTTLLKDPLSISGPVKISCWLKGQGRVWMALNFNDNLKKTIYRKGTGPITVNTDKWRKYSWDTDILNLVKKAGVPRPKSVRIEFIFSGKIDIDKISAMTVEDINIQNRETIKDLTIKYPYMACPKLARPPKVDGNIDTGEWREAACTTGFVELGTNKLSKRQTMVYTGYDDKNIYFAFYTIRRGHMGFGGETKGSLFSQHIDGIEIWIKSPEKAWYHFLGNPAGGKISNAEKAGTPIPVNKWLYKSQVSDSGETKGGIITFDKKIWTSEIAISFEDLGVAPPKPGETWKINFCSDYSVKKGSSRTANDWNTWAYVKGFKDIENFGNICFLPDIPGVKVLKTGNLSNGIIELGGDVFAPQNEKINIFTWLAPSGNPGEIIFSDYGHLNISEKTSTDFLIPALINLKSKTELDLFVSINSANTKTLLSQLKLPFVCQPAFSIDVVPVYEKHILYIKPNTEKLSTLPDSVDLAIRIINKDNGKELLSHNTTVPRNKLTNLITLDISKFTSGNYKISCMLKKDNRDLYETVAYLEIPDLTRFPWLNNRLGISDDVPPPWTPVKTEKDKVFVTERVYTLNNCGLPEQVEIKGKPVFRDPPRIVGIINGKSVYGKFDQLKIVEQKPAWVKWKLNGKLGSLDINGILKIEFDGFALWEFTISCDKPVKINSLYIDFPFRKDSAFYARGENFLIHDGRYYAALFNQQKPTDMEIGLAHFSKGDWNWPEIMMHNIWLGNDTSGFALMTESDENFQGKKKVEIINDKDAEILRYNLISRNFNIKDPLIYEIAWQATPVKPRPKDPKIWRTSNMQKDKDKEGFKKRVFGCLAAYHALYPLCYPKVYGNKKAAQKKREEFQKYDVKLTPYFGLCFVGEEIPEWKYFKNEWEVHPQNGWSYLRGKAAYANTCSSFGNYIVWAAKEVYDKLGYDGVYLDVSGPSGSSNPYHGAGYLKDGKRYQTVNIFKLRDVYKRLYSLYKSKGRKGIIFRHQMLCAALDGFADIITGGEYWCTERFNQYKRLTPELFRTREMKTQYGSPFTWYAFHHYYRGERFGGRTPLNEILVYCLPHNVMPGIAHADMWPVWDLLDKWWTSSEFIPYWNPDCPVTADQKNILTSVYRKDSSALIPVANWSESPIETDVIIDLTKLFKDGQNKQIIARNALTKEKIPIEKGQAKVSLGKKDLIFLEVTTQ